MTIFDWIILIATLLGTIIYGVYQSKASKTAEGFVLSNKSMPGYLVLVSIMATQASAITFISAPGQAYDDGMRFIQSYFGLPIAMIFISIVFVKIYQSLGVFSAYEYLEKRFDNKTRTFTAILFLVSRGLSTGISIYAPALIFSILLGWNIYLSMFIVGGLLAIYTVLGGARAITYTMQFQFVCIMSIYIFILIWLKTQYFATESWSDIFAMAGQKGKLNIITTGFENGKFNWNDKFNIWSGVLAGFFHSLSYFGTDQSQVGRFLTAKNMDESKKGLIWNGILKIPMQFFLLFIGVMVFLYYQKNSGPIYFHEKLKTEANTTIYKPTLDSLEKKYLVTRSVATRKLYLQTIKKALPGKDIKDTDYVFLQFVKDHIPAGIKGFLLGLILLASWGSIAAAIHALATATWHDFKFNKSKQKNSKQEFKKLQLYTVLWVVICLAIALTADILGNSLIEAVNIIGSWFYGVILGIFLVGFFIKHVKGHAIFTAAFITQIIVIVIYFLKIVSYLWLNIIGVVLVCLISLFLQQLFKFLK